MAETQIQATVRIRDVNHMPTMTARCMACGGFLDDCTPRSWCKLMVGGTEAAEFTLCVPCRNVTLEDAQREGALAAAPAPETQP